MKEDSQSELYMEDAPLNRNFRWFKIILSGPDQKPRAYIFRGLTRAELRLAGTKEKEADSEHFILNSCVKGKYDWDNMLLGVVRRLLDEIYKATGITEDGLTFKEALAWIKSSTGAMEAAAVSMVAGCTLETLNHCDSFDYAKYCYLGKWTFETMFGVELEVAFGLKEPEVSDEEGFVNVSVKDSGPVAPGRGEVGQQVQQYTWKKMKDPNANK